MMKNVLLFTASAGGGHNSAARAIKGALDKFEFDTTVVDALKFVSPMLDRIVSGGYETSAKLIPQTYGSIYKISGGKARKNNLDVLIRQVMGKKILQLVENEKPDL
jgi:processive 1,2-diacylglycerol beta-glucosyltransferase